MTETEPLKITVPRHERRRRAASWGAAAGKRASSRNLRETRAEGRTKDRQNHDARTEAAFATKVRRNELREKLTLVFDEV